MATFVLDSNVFNQWAQNLLKREQFPDDAEFVVTHVQIDELNNTPDRDRRALLLLNLAQWRPTLVPVESMVWDATRWDHAKWSDGEMYIAIRAALDEQAERPNNVHDGLIAEVALKNGFTLVTGDGVLARTIEVMGGKVMHFRVNKAA